jgi:hypothetical protein
MANHLFNMPITVSREPFLMEASYHPKEVLLKKGSWETIMPLF